MKKLVVMVIMMLGLAGAWVLVGRSQLLERRASVEEAGLLILPSEANLEPGQTIEVVVRLDTKSHVVNGVEAKINFEKDKLTLAGVVPVTVTNVIAGQKAFLKNSDDLVGLGSAASMLMANSQGWINIKGIRVEDNPASYQTGILSIVKLIFTAKGGGLAKIWVDQAEPLMAVGYRLNESVEVPVSSDVVEAQYQISGVATGPSPTTTPALVNITPITVQAESYTEKNGSGNSQSTTDVGGGANMGWITNGSTFKYSVNVPVDGWYRFDYRVARPSSTQAGNINLLVGNSGAVASDTVSVPVTDGWQNWRTISGKSVYLTSGQTNLYIRASGGGGYLFNINWFKLTRGSDVAVPSVTPVILSATPTPTPTIPPVGAGSSVWTKLASQLPEGLAPYYATALDEANGRVYVVGGYSATAARIASRSVYKGVIGTNGSISWTKQIDYPARVKGSYAFVANGRLYNVGGDDSAGTITSNTYSAEIGSNGDLGGWRLETNLRLPVGNHFMAGIKFKERIYVIGGRVLNASTNSEYSNERVYRLKTSMDGWEPMGMLPNKLGMAGVAAFGDYLYLGGGQVLENSNVYRCDTEKIYKTSLTTSGVLGTWVEAGELTGATNAYNEANRQTIPSLGIRSAHGMVAIGGKLYVLPAGSWARSASNADDGSQCRNAAAKAYKKPDYLSATTRSLMANISADGSLGSLSTFGHSESNRILDLGLWNLDGLPYGYYGSFVYGGRLYMVGGMNFAGVTKNIYWISL